MRRGSAGPREELDGAALLGLPGWQHIRLDVGVILFRGHGVAEIGTTTGRAAAGVAVCPEQPGHQDAIGPVDAGGRGRGVGAGLRAGGKSLSVVRVFVPPSLCCRQSVRHTRTKDGFLSVVGHCDIVEAMHMTSGSVPKQEVRPTHRSNVSSLACANLLCLCFLPDSRLHHSPSLCAGCGLQLGSSKVGVCSHMFRARFCFCLKIAC
uniref:Uncharacterized protein n=1 Tax=Spumella elongata TaxID=89044 RepID=A0A7S3ME53_9STRA|mmetsp:Transcript_61610/g.201080  ORF Transcript_61610/g.201080 Transcript_61610/m.201080 type:complete len:207 (+) Transcript_61610:394-1014(+)